MIVHFWRLIHQYPYRCLLPLMPECSHIHCNWNNAILCEVHETRFNMHLWTSKITLLHRRMSSKQHFAMHLSRNRNLRIIDNIWVHVPLDNPAENDQSNVCWDILFLYDTVGVLDKIYVLCEASAIPEGCQSRLTINQWFTEAATRSWCSHQLATTVSRCNCFLVCHKQKTLNQPTASRYGDWKRLPSSSTQTPYLWAWSHITVSGRVYLLAWDAHVSIII